MSPKGIQYSHSETTVSQGKLREDAREGVLCIDVMWDIDQTVGHQAGIYCARVSCFLVKLYESHELIGERGCFGSCCNTQVSVHWSGTQEETHNAKSYFSSCIEASCKAQQW